MTVAERPEPKARKAQRVQQLAPHVDALVLAARQLQLSLAEVGRALEERWERAAAGAARAPAAGEEHE